MNELDARMENMLATVDKVYNVEVMKMPLSLRNTLLADLMSGECEVGGRPAPYSYMKDCG